MAKKVEFGLFEWDEAKDRENIVKHGVDFRTASRAFLDENRPIAEDEAHSIVEPRLFCIGSVDSKVVTTRFSYRKNKMRIIGAGFWRKGKRFYEKEHKRR